MICRLNSPVKLRSLKSSPMLISVTMYFSLLLSDPSLFFADLLSCLGLFSNTEALILFLSSLELQIHLRRPAEGLNGLSRDTSHGRTDLGP